MHQELVEKRRWLSEGRFLHALNYCMVLPGPEAQQLATYIGWLMHRTWGGIVAGVLFVLPSLFILIGLSWVYMAYGQTTLVAGLFFGIKPAVTAIVLQAAWRIGSRALKNNLLVGDCGGGICRHFCLRHTVSGDCCGRCADWLCRRSLAMPGIGSKGAVNTEKVPKFPARH
jgi:chromate transporter